MGIILNRLCRTMAPCLLALLLLGGCSGGLRNQMPHYAKQIQSQQLDTMISQMTPRSELQEKVKSGIVALRGGDYDKATSLFQAALRLDPANGHIHFLNALSYHMSFLDGNSKKLDLARAGYLTALKFDESNDMAAYFLGQIYFHQKNYAEAQDQFSYGLLYAPDNPDLLRALSTASYYAHDIATSKWASQRAYAVDAESPATIRNLIFAKAASGDFGQVDTLLDKYGAATKSAAQDGGSYWDDARLARTSHRIGDWKTFYAANDPLIFTTPSPDIVTYSSPPDSGESGGSGASGNEDFSLEAPGQQQTPQSLAQRQGPRNDLLTASPRASGAPATANGPRLPKMANVDVVILRTEEIRSQSKGINLLDSLRTTLSGTLVDFQLVEGVDSSGKSTDSRTTTIHPSLNLMDLEYNLNIFNDGVNKAEVLARPSLLATEGATSNFFSGGELHVQLSSNNYDGSLVDIPIGITLNVTPTFYGDDTLEILVHAEHSFLQMQAEEVGFTSFSQTTKTSVDATAILKFGETLILSGLSERSNDKSSSGVPLLQDIPGVQYLFSRDEQLDSKKSILILLTPRKATYAKDTMTPEELANKADLERTHTSDLKKKEVIANTNLNAAMAHLSEYSEFYRQFRTGDMDLSFWENDDSLVGAIKRILEFVYY